ncbi:M23 family metallopeptidase [Candidatus Gracilibacteria bacterium]|nr:M23 family metallopeptidase [Candidatus Gracilibacteria bacterium]
MHKLSTLIIENLEATLQVNKLARRIRHLKNFSKWNLFRSYVKSALGYASVPVKALQKTKAFKAVAKVTMGLELTAKNLLPIAPQRRLLFNSIIVAVSAVTISSFSQVGTFAATSYDYSSDYISSYSVSGDILVADDAGYLVKINPQTNVGSRVGLTDYATHSVESGETLSLIAGRYGVSTNTILWENNLSNPNALRTGQKLLVPPVDGVSYKVKSGDNLEKIGKKYAISSEAIVAQNALDTELLSKGQSLFLPGAKPLYSAPTYVARNSTATRNSRTYNFTATNSSAAPTAGKIFIFPTRGKVTQGFRAGHYALDIGDRSKPAIWAGGSGVITKASSGTWGGGYGNHVIIDHGNGVKSLYAHMDHLIVSVGQYVQQGEVLGQMGNTGRVYGATGIHLHWEVIDNGVKRNPYNYF